MNSFADALRIRTNDRLRVMQRTHDALRRWEYWQQYRDCPTCWQWAGVPCIDLDPAGKYLYLQTPHPRRISSIKQEKK